MTSCNVLLTFCIHARPMFALNLLPIHYKSSTQLLSSPNFMFIFYTSKSSVRNNICPEPAQNTTFIIWFHFIVAKCLWHNLT